MEWRSDEIPKEIYTTDDSLRRTLDTLDSKLTTIHGPSKALLNTFDTAQICRHISTLKCSCPVENFENIRSTYGSVNPYVLCVCPVRFQRDRASLEVQVESRKLIEDFFKMRNRHRECIVFAPSEEDDTVAVPLLYGLYGTQLDYHKIGIHGKNSISSDNLYRRNALYILTKLSYAISSIKIMKEFTRLQDNVTSVLKAAFDYKNVRTICHRANLYDRINKKNVGTAYDKTYQCYWVRTVNAIKKDLLEKTLAKLAFELSDKIASDLLHSVRRLLESIAMEDLRKVQEMHEHNLFMFDNLLSVIRVLLMQIFQPLMAVIAFIKVLIWSVDVNSFEWRNNVADEISENLKERFGNIEGKCVTEVQTFFRGMFQEILDIKTVVDEEVKRLYPLVPRPLTVELFASGEEPFRYQI